MQSGDADAFVPAAWKFVEEHKSEIAWDLVTLCPPFVSHLICYQTFELATHTISDIRRKLLALFQEEGCLRLVVQPITHEVHSYESLNTSTLELYKTVKGQRSNEDLVQPVSSFADVRDVASAHVLAITTPDAGGRRFLTTSGIFNVP